MERSGMRWTEQMAEAIVQLRAIYLSGDFDALDDVPLPDVTALRRGVCWG
jgi:hypothetical protein